MNRRTFLAALLAGTVGTLVSAPKATQAKFGCRLTRVPGWNLCEAGIDSRIVSVVAAAVGGQHLDNWCWAACIEMVFRYYGYDVPQEDIVVNTWGDIVNLPAYYPQIMANLNGQWTDRNGRLFNVLGDTYTANPVTAAQDLAQDMPLIIATLSHAMVLTSLQYWLDRYGNWRISAAVVRDPWPGNGTRYLTATEWNRANLLARIRIYPA